MKVLILSVTAGYGHHATAQAIGDMLKNKGAEVDTLDVYAYISNLIKTTIDKGYLFSSKHMQTLYRLVYQLAENNGAKLFLLCAEHHQYHQCPRRDQIRARHFRPRAGRHHLHACFRRADGG